MSNVVMISDGEGVLVPMINPEEDPKPARWWDKLNSDPPKSANDLNDYDQSTVARSPCTEVDDDRVESEETRRFKLPWLDLTLQTRYDWVHVAQLITEILVIMFAAGLLILVVIVILSSKIPDIMDSYEIIPKTLFFLCIVVAIFSFCRWLIMKLLLALGLIRKKIPETDLVDA